MQRALSVSDANYFNSYVSLQGNNTNNALPASVSSPTAFWAALACAGLDRLDGRNRNCGNEWEQWKQWLKRLDRCNRNGRNEWEQWLNRSDRVNRFDGLDWER